MILPKLLSTSDMQAVVEWLADPEAVPHGDVSTADLLKRAAACPDAQTGEGKVVAVTHATAIRAAIIRAIKAMPLSFWRLDVKKIASRCASMRDEAVMRRMVGFCPWIAFGLCLASSSPAWAHHREAPRDAATDGIAIPDLLHGQMAAIAASRAAILDLAARQTPTDRVMRRLETFINLQFSACLWGLVPGSLQDEDSPFNECAHAHLAATRALLLHLQGMPGDRAPARALLAAVELDMLKSQAPLAMCRYSGQAFNTAEVIHPAWKDIPFHPTSLASFLGLALAAIGCGWMAARRLSPRPYHRAR